MHRMKMQRQGFIVEGRKVKCIGQLKDTVTELAREEDNIAVTEGNILLQYQKVNILYQKQVVTPVTEDVTAVSEGNIVEVTAATDKVT